MLFQKQFLIRNFFLILTLPAAAQQSWQGLQNPTPTQVLAHWQSPPPEYGPEPYYGLNGPVTLATVQRDLDTMKSLGFQAVTVQYGYGASFAYLSPEYFAFFQQFVAEAKKRDMRIWIVDDAGYPSGFAGGKFSTEHPELRMQALVATRRAVKAGEHITLPENAVTATAGGVPMANEWTAPADTDLTVVTHIFSTSPTRSDTNPNRVKDGSQSLEDYLSPDATAQYLAFTHAAYKAAVGDGFGHTILGFRGDEPDYSIAGLPWTPRFFDRFQQIKGYDIRPYLAAFTPNEHHPGQKDAPLAPLTPQQLRAKADYYDVFATLFRDGFFKPQGDWCAANHLEYQVHLNHEEMELQLAHSEGDFFRDMQYVQVPGIDSIWHQIWTDTISDFPRLAASAAHLYGHPRAFTESFAAYRPTPDVTMARYILNEQFVRGINLVETMYYPATSTPGRGGPAEFMRDPAYPALMAYTRRLSYLMSQGHPAANVALLLPSASLWMNDTTADDTFVSTERLLSEHQLDFDILTEDFLATPYLASKVGCPTCRFYNPEMKGILPTLSGNAFRTVIIPAASVMSETSLTNLRTFAQQGGKVLFLGATPTLIAGKTFLDARPATPADFTFATTIRAQLDPTPTPPAQPPTAPPSPQAVPAEILAVLSKIPSDLTLATPTPALRYIHRTLDGAAVFLLFNESAAPIHNQLTLHAVGRRELWNPETGAVTPIGKGPAIPLDLAPYATEILVLRTK